MTLKWLLINQKSEMSNSQIATAWYFLKGRIQTKQVIRIVKNKCHFRRKDETKMCLNLVHIWRSKKFQMFLFSKFWKYIHRVPKSCHHLSQFIQISTTPSQEAGGLSWTAFYLLVKKPLVETLSLLWRRSQPYRNQSIDLQSKSMGWFLFNKNLRHERVKPFNA